MESKRKLLRHIPVELVAMILARLPSKSVVRCRCVCKAWRVLISEPEFIKRHRDQNGNVHLLIQYDEIETETYRRGCKTSKFSLHNDTTFRKHATFKLPYKGLRVLGCSNGLVCLTSGGLDAIMDIFLWNPSIQKLKLVPTCLLDSDPGISSSSCHYGTDAILLYGFVPKLDDYRIVKIISSGSMLYSAIIHSYSLSSDSWKRVDNVTVPYEFSYSMSFIVVEGVVYFIGNQSEDNDYDDDDDFVINDTKVFSAFDLADGDFNDDMSIPYLVLSSMPADAYLSVLGDSFLVFCIYPGTIFPDERTVVWENLKEDNGDAAEPWSEKLIMDDLIFPLGSSKNGGLFVTSINQQLSLFDPRNSEKTYFRSVQVPQPLRECTEYKESLVLLDKVN